jgi:mannose-6-phosphate isomerase-like protein (cupin superfamily)
MDCSRRELCFALPVILGWKAQVSGTTLLRSKMYPFESLPTHVSRPNKFRPVFDERTHDGFRVALHETTLAPGSMPHPPHHHAHEEVFLIRQGEVVVTVGGQSSTLGAGSVAFIASNEEHSIRNPGSAHAEYFVLELGAETS